MVDWWLVSDSPVNETVWGESWYMSHIELYWLSYRMRQTSVLNAVHVNGVAGVGVVIAGHTHPVLYNTQ